MLMLDLLAVALVKTVRCLLLVYHSLATVTHCVIRESVDSLCRDGADARIA